MPPTLGEERERERQREEEEKRILHIVRLQIPTRTTISTMQVYHYCLFLLGLVAIIRSVRSESRSLTVSFTSSSRYIEFDRDEYDLNPPAHHYYRNHAYQPVDLERYLRYLVAADARDDYNDDGPLSLERRGKAITKGDPREFMG